MIKRVVIFFKFVIFIAISIKSLKMKKSNSSFFHAVVLWIPTNDADFCMGLNVRIVSHMADEISYIPSSNPDDERNPANAGL